MLHYDGHQAGRVLNRLSEAAQSKNAFSLICHLLPEALAIAENACGVTNIDLETLLAAQPDVRRRRSSALVALPRETRIGFEQVVMGVESDGLRRVTATAARNASSLIRLLLTMKAEGRLSDIITSWTTRVD